MAKSDALNQILGANGQWKCIVPASSSVMLLPPASLKQGDVATDGQQIANGNSVQNTRRVVRLLVTSGGAALNIYDANAVANAVTANQIWGKTVAAGDTYVTDCLLVNGLYVTTGAGVQVTVIFT